MAVRRAPKANYKIFDKKREKYLTGGRNKATWTSRTWVMAAALDFCSRQPAGYMRENIEIHIFPIENAIRVSWTDMVNEVKAEEEANKEKKAAQEAKKKMLEEEQEKRDLIKRYDELKAAAAKMRQKAKQLGLTLEKDGSYVIREGEHKPFKDEYGNVDWRDKGEMGG